MSFFNVPDSLKKPQAAAGNAESALPKRTFNRPITDYADLDDPSPSSFAPSAPERRPRLAATMQDRSQFSLRRTADGSIVPKPSFPPRSVPQFGGASTASKPPARGTLTRAGLIPAGARNPYTLKRTVAGKPDIPERHPSPATFDESTEEGEVEDEEKPPPAPRSSRVPQPPPQPPTEPTFKFGGGFRSLLSGTVAGSGSTTGGGETRSLFGGAARSISPSNMVLRKREASPLAPPPPPPPRAAAAANPHPPPQPEAGRERSSARTLAAHDLTGMRNVNDVAKQLRKLVGRPCPGDFDRYQLLDERDRLLWKLREIHPKFFSKSGSCLEMCPEKERYVRVVQMRVADYEMDMFGEMEPRRMVKEYSRSAADQEEPLEHELRPAEVLEVTMEYLLTDIVDTTVEASPDSSKWYDFLWNRTRAIRKELTQQSILNEAAVRLIESCTRMHMYAGFALSRLRQEEFDPKMNEENLSKCLQSLRHLYEDLAKKEIFVESEAEFRAYDVMLHLTDSNILRQVLSYRRVVRDSPAVRLALKLFSTIQSNNYSRFFRLVREQATFSQCCILIRYFGRMRLQAFSTMVVAYTRGPLPIAKIKDQLAFESDEQTIDVAAQYGLSYTQDAAGVPALIPDGRDFDASAGEISVPVSWIDGKRAGLRLSEVFRGGPPRISVEQDRPEPVDSFDPSTGAYSHDPVVSAYLARLGAAAGVPDEPSAHAAAPQRRPPIVVERPAAAPSYAAVAAAAAAKKPAAAAAATSSRPAFGGLTGASLFGKPATGAAPAAAAVGGAFGGGSSLFGKSAMGGGASTVSSFGGGSASAFGGGGAKSGFSFASAESSVAGVVSPPSTMFGGTGQLTGIKQEASTTVSNLDLKPRLAESEVKQTAEKLYDRVVEEEARKVARETLEEERRQRRQEEERREAEKQQREAAMREQQAREARELEERAAAAAAAAKTAEKRRRSQLARLSSCSDHLFKRTLWPSLVKEVIDAATKEIAREAVREEEERIAAGIARYRAHMHSLWLRQFTNQWKAYAKWKKEQRARVRQVLAAVVSRNPLEGFAGQSMKRRLSAPLYEEAEKKKRRTYYGHLDPMTALALISFVERREASIARGVLAHWRAWAERRARRKHAMMWQQVPRGYRVAAMARLRAPTSPTDENERRGGYGNTSLPVMETEGGGAISKAEKRHKSRRSVGLYPFLSADDSFLDGRATPLGGTPIREDGEEERRESRRRQRLSGIFNSTALPESTAAPAMGFATFVDRLQAEKQAASDQDVEYALAMMDQTQWRMGAGARERMRRALRKMESVPPLQQLQLQQQEELDVQQLHEPSWRGLFDVLNAEPERSSELAARRALETPEGMGRRKEGEEEKGTAAMPPLPWQREHEEEKVRLAARAAELARSLEASARLRAEVAADRARQEELLARCGC